MLAALQFYEKLVGLDAQDVPEFIANHPNYLKVKPQTLVDLGVKYKINFKRELHLLW